jgi:predicted Zn-dependent protease
MTRRPAARTRSALRPGAGWTVLLLVLSSCTCDADSVNRGDLNLVTLDQEWQMGEELAAEVARQVRLVDDPRVVGPVREMGQRLASQTEMADRPWHFYVVDDPSVNAFALPGGHVYVHTGLIEAARSPDELASVVGHEVAHVAARHSTERMVAANGLNLVANLVLGEDGGLVQQIAADLIGRSAMARFSRGDEREADDLGLVFLDEAGYDPTAMARMFETLLAARQSSPNALERWFSSHPVTEERIERAREAAEQIDAR